MDNKKSRRRSTINEADINGYLHTKKEATYKKIIWELLNKDYTTQKQQPMKSKNNDKKKKRVAASQVDMEMDEEKKKKTRLGSRINFDILEKATGDPEEVPRKLEDNAGESEVGDDEKLSCGGSDADYRDGFQEEEENNEDTDYGDRPVYIEDEGEEDGHECQDADDDDEYWNQY